MENLNMPRWLRFFQSEEQIKRAVQGMKQRCKQMLECVISSKSFMATK